MGVRRSHVSCEHSALSPKPAWRVSLSGNYHDFVSSPDDCFSGTGTVLIGGRTMYTIQYNHRTALVYSNDVSAQSLGEGHH